MARIVVSGYIVRYPLGGNVMAHLSYVVGLARLGHEVWFLEDAGWERSCYDPTSDVMTSDASYGTAFIAALFAQFGLADRWAFRDAGGRWHGNITASVEDLIEAADLYLEVGGVSHFPEMRGARRRAYVDMDPFFTQTGDFAGGRLTEFDTLFTYGTNIGGQGCIVPTLGLEWHPLRPPTLVDWWSAPLPQVSPPTVTSCWTTVGSWSAYGAREYQGEWYGQKDLEFGAFIDLPRDSPVCLELALGGDTIPFDLLKRHGWKLVDALEVSSDLDCYRTYVRRSRGEFSVAKHAYVKARTGWLSDRSASYLAAGRPVVVQDTGAGQAVPTGEGLLRFSTPSEALAALNTVERDYQSQADAARNLAQRYFDVGIVLNGMLDVCGVTA